MKNAFMLMALFAASTFSAAAALADDATFTITEKDKQFSPQPLTVPAGVKIKLTVKNLDAMAAEFESRELNREKIVSANGEITVYIGPLDAGSYGYFDDLHPNTKGTIIAQ